MDFALQITLFSVSIAMFIIVLALYGYTYLNGLRINKLLAQANVLAEKSAEDGYLLAESVAGSFAKWVEPHAVAANMAYAANRYIDARRHAAKAVLLSNAISPWLTSYYEEVLCSEGDNTQNCYCERLKNWMHDTANRAAILEKYESNDYSGALEQLDKLSEEDQGKLPVADAWRAHFYLLLGDFQRAETHLQQAEKCQADDGQHISIRGHWYLIHGDEKGAIECYRRHNNADSLNQDFKHLEMVFGIKPPNWQ